MTVAAFAAVQFIIVHMIDGEEVLINVGEVTTMRVPRDVGDPRRQTPPEVNCIIWFTDGRYLSVAETCEKVRKLME